MATNKDLNVKNLWYFMAGRLLSLATGRALRLPASHQIEDRYGVLLTARDKVA